MTTKKHTWQTPAEILHSCGCTIALELMVASSLIFAFPTSLVDTDFQNASKEMLFLAFPNVSYGLELHLQNSDLLCMGPKYTAGFYQIPSLQGTNG